MLPHKGQYSPVDGHQQLQPRSQVLRHVTQAETACWLHIQDGMRVETMVKEVRPPSNAVLGRCSAIWGSGVSTWPAHAQTWHVHELTVSQTWHVQYLHTSKATASLPSCGLTNDRAYKISVVVSTCEPASSSTTDQLLGWCCRSHRCQPDPDCRGGSRQCLWCCLCVPRATEASSMA